jgi:hypothetical protein
MKPVYTIYKKEVPESIDCGLQEFIEHGRSLIMDGSIADLNEFGADFLSDCDELGKVYKAYEAPFKRG